VIRARVSAARARQGARFVDTPWRVNADVPGPDLLGRWPLTEVAARALAQRVYSGGLTGRGGTRVHRLAWTVADLRGRERPGIDELDVALRLRTGEPLLLGSVDLAGAG